MRNNGAERRDWDAVAVAATGRRRSVYFNGVRLAPAARAPYRCGASSSDGWICDKVEGHRGDHVAACTYVTKTGKERYDEIMKRWKRRETP